MQCSDVMKDRLTIAMVGTTTSSVQGVYRRRPICVYCAEQLTINTI